MLIKVGSQMLQTTAVTAGTYTNANITVNAQGQIVSASNGVITASGSGGGPKITNLQVTNSSWTVLDDTAVDLGGGYFVVTGTDFVSGCLVYIGQTPANSVGFVSATTVRVTVPATAAGTYPVYLVNPDGGTAIRVPGINFSASPAWQTAGSLPDQYDNMAINLSLVATDATSYTLTSGSLPPGLSLNSNTGIISGTVTTVTVDTTYTFTVRATDAQLQDSPRTFTVTITVSDPYFKLTTLLLTGNSGATVVTDASTNNFPITVFGDSRASNFSPYLTGWSVFFDGNADYLTIPPGPAFAYGTGAFTLEVWIYRTALGPAPYYGGVIFTQAASSNNYFHLAANADNKIDFLYTNTALTSTRAISFSTWTHIAVVREGTGTNQFKLYINGVVDTVSTVATNFTDTSLTISIGDYSHSQIVGFAGYISDLRLVKGTAVYTTNFIPPTAPLEAIAGTSLLTCQSNRFRDSSPNNFTVTRYNNASVQSYNPFNLTNTGTTGSMYFDGTGDYLTWAGTTIGANPFCFETWVYFTGGFASIQALLGIWVNGVTGDLSIRVNSATQICFDRSGVSASNFTVPTLTNNQWYHIVACRNAANNSTIFVNGIRSSTGVVADSYAYPKTTSIAGLYSGVPQHVTGYMSNVRLIVGSTPYDPTQTTLTVPTAPLTAIANTQLLILQNRQPHNNHSFQDSSANNHLITRSGNTTQGTFSPFSQMRWSNYFNGSSSLSFNSGANCFAAASEDFTIEAFVYLTSFNDNNMLIGWNKTGYDYFTIASSGIGLNLNNTYTVGYGYQFASNTWYHIAVSRQSNSIKAFINGQQIGSVINNSQSFGAANITTTIGNWHTVPNWFLSGYVSNFRFVKGVAVYTGNFTLPTSPLTATQSAGTNIAAITGTETSILTCQSNRFVDNSASPKTITVNGSPSIQAFSPYAPTAVWSAAANGGSGYFDGSGDWLTIPGASAFNFGTSNFTIEEWFYIDTDKVINGSNGGMIFDYNYEDIQLYYVTSPVKLYCDIRNWGTNVSLASTSTIALGQWYHVAIVRDGLSSVKMYLNGILEDTKLTNPGSINLNTYPLVYGARLGPRNSPSSPDFLHKGYISGARILNGTAINFASTEIPTSPPTNITNTSLLLNFTNAAISDATGRNLLETVGDARTTSVVAKWAGQTSMSFDGTGDYLAVPANVLHNQLYATTRSFTIEFWIYLLAYAGAGVAATIISTHGGGGGADGWRIETSPNSPATNIRWVSNGADTACNATIELNTWIHYAFTYNGTTVKVFKNGALGNTATTSWTNNTGRMFIGTANADLNFPLTAYMADIRITNAERYTSNFTPPIGPARLK